LRQNDPELDYEIARTIRTERLMPHLKKSNTQAVILMLRDEYSANELAAKVPCLNIDGRKRLIEYTKCAEQVLDTVLTYEFDDDMAEAAIRNSNITKANALKVMRWKNFSNFNRYCKINWSSDLPELMITHPEQAGLILHKLLLKEEPIAASYLRSKDPAVRNVLLTHSRLNNKWLSIFFESPATEFERRTLIKHQVLKTESIPIVAAQGLSPELIESIIKHQPVGKVWLTYIAHLLNESMLEALDKAVNHPGNRFGNRYMGAEALIESWKDMESFIERLSSDLIKYVCDHSSRFSAEMVNHCRPLI
jgi:hypothetical protein